MWEGFIIEPISFGLVGVGGYAAVYLRVLRALEDEGLAKISAVVIRSPWKYVREVEYFRGRSTAIYGSFEEMVEAERGRIDIVALPTAIYEHKDMAVKALKSGFNVILEKPPAVTVQDLDEMIEAERASGKFCAVGFQLQSKTVVRRIKEAVCEGKIGEVKYVLSKGKWKRLDSYYERNAWAGKFMYEGKYVLDGTVSNPLSHYLMSSLFFASGGEGRAAYPVGVRAELYRGHKIEGEDTSCLEAEVDGGARVFFFATLCSPHQSSPSQRIIGTRGLIDWTFGDNAYIRYADGGVETIEEDGKDERIELFRNAIRYLRGLDESINCTLELTRPFVLTLNGAYESARRIKDIPNEFIIRRAEEDSIATVIIGIDDIIDKAFEAKQLFSDLGVEWAYKTEYFPLENYRRFNLVL